MIIAWLLFLIFLIYMGTRIIKKEYLFETFILDFLFICIVGVFLLIFPLLKNYHGFEKILYTIFYTLQSIVMNQDTSVIDFLLLGNVFEHLYHFILQCLFILMPVLTIGVILNYITDLITELKLKNSTRNDEIHIFSEINSKTLFLSEKIFKKENTDNKNKKIVKKTIIFASKEDKKTHVKSINIKDNITDICINKKNKKIIFYALSLDEEKNINDGLKLIQKYKDYPNVTIYVLCNDKNNAIIFDSIDKGHIILEIVNEIERTIYNLLDTNPLYIDSIDKTISILIVGCGEVGKEFLRDATWCSIIPEYQYKATVNDIKANEIKEKIEIEKKEFLKNYNISFIEADYKSTKTINFIKNNTDINYILVSMDTDKKNLDAAIMLRENFLKIHNRMPSIHLWCKKDMKMEQINKMKTHAYLPYQIHAFGSDKDIYYENMIINSKFERIAMEVHVAYKDKIVTEEEQKQEYNKREYDKRSSRANALHIKYKFFAILGDKFTNDMKKNQEIFKSMYNDKIEHLLLNNEHDRWNAYERSIGYTYVSPHDVEKYFKQINKHENSLSKQHPALVKNEELDKVSNELAKFEPDIDLKSYDINILRGLINGKINL